MGKRGSRTRDRAQKEAATTGRRTEEEVETAAQRLCTFNPGLQIRRAAVF